MLSIVYKAIFSGFRFYINRSSARLASETTFASWASLDFPALALELLTLFVGDELPPEELADAWMGRRRCLASEMCTLWIPVEIFVTKSEASEWFLVTILCKILTLGSAIL
jgi:hypothetical protein